LHGKRGSLLAATGVIEYNRMRFEVNMRLASIAGGGELSAGGDATIVPETDPSGDVRRPIAWMTGIRRDAGALLPC